ncbi:MAG: efflux transporter periplasmic adaptor subunit [Cytophagales bacterium CG18_big_fil_WC_8_21_14_2_50_42_9]|nr:MAG: efflux transporter periplasmic adaptor subunit [Cytophagales bacterium CG18_big_fil_WC_8_21_14_2_50_42_9]
MSLGFISIKKTITNLAVASIMVIGIFSCGKNEGQGGGPGGPGGAGGGPQEPQNFAVFSLSPRSATLYSDYPATLEGEQNIEIRPKVEGYVEKIYIKEGAAVKKGQLLFKISAPQYEQEVRTATAAITSAQAQVNTAQLQVNKTKPLVEKEIISHFELESAENSLKTAKANLAQARSTLANAKTNLGYTTLSSPVSGVIGTLPHKVGSLVNGNITEPLTTVSNIQKMYAYFSLNEKQLLEFSRTYSGKTISEKLKNIPPVSLILSDGSTYSEKGKVETASGLLNTQTGSATLRATFPNPVGLLRSGGSGTVRIPQEVTNGILVPQKSTYELQGKRFVYVVDQAGKVKSTEIQIMSLPAGQFYVVTSGLKAGDEVVFEGGGTIQDGTEIKPQIMAANEVYQGLQ